MSASERVALMNEFFNLVPDYWNPDTGRFTWANKGPLPVAFFKLCDSYSELGEDVGSGDKMNEMITKVVKRFNEVTQPGVVDEKRVRVKIKDWANGGAYGGSVNAHDNTSSQKSGSPRSWSGRAARSGEAGEGPEGVQQSSGRVTRQMSQKSSEPKEKEVTVKRSLEVSVVSENILAHIQDGAHFEEDVIMAFGRKSRKRLKKVERGEEIKDKYEGKTVVWKANRMGVEDLGKKMVKPWEIPSKKG